MIRDLDRAARLWLAGGAAFMVLVLAFHLWTRPPAMPGYTETRAAWAPSEAYLKDRNGRLLDAIRVDFATRRLAWAPLDAIAPALPRALIAAEDRRFRFHGGVDWLALAGAVRDRIAGRPLRGASTITMQLAGLLDPTLGGGGRRSLHAKLVQMRAARAIEGHWSKDQILEAYLNLVTFRGEIQGVDAAARILAAKAPAALSASESTVLAALLPAPSASPRRVATRACRIANRSGLSASCPALPATAADMLGRRARTHDPDLAPHLARRLLDRPGISVTSTLDARAQSFVAQALGQQLDRIGARAARDGAAVVIDNASGEVLAYVGSGGGSSRAAAVDGASAYRQAGSTLKPFLYGLAIERGYLTAASLLDDSPVHLDTATGLYVPQNYDRGFHGLVSARTALGSSLNVPAVRTLLLTGVEPFRDRLWDAGYRGLTQDGDFYGYSLALGSAEVTLVEQAAAYRMLARGGLWSPLRFRPDEADKPDRRVMPEAAAAIVADMLADPGARALSFGLDNQLGLPFWAAVKTGTSKAMRDNWCVGFSQRYTVAVWIGNFEGDSMTGVSGVTGAAPVWRDIMLGLHAGQPPATPARPQGIEERVIRFAPAVEPERHELFLAGTGQNLFAATAPAAGRPRIVTPVAGTIYALDPDIPPGRQQVRFAAAGVDNSARLVLDGRPLAVLDQLWNPVPGAHRLVLADANGKALDSVLFHVR